ncbi:MULTISPECIES: hypothetical protein [unclassified Halomonas]|uniref:hypothetical protein n=1 Tax=unclassified Halomonas TaxID=2609666 RepID=UPI002076A222|nr:MULTISPECIES: hypothetical protein [unclassified Halomonas]
MDSDDVGMRRFTMHVVRSKEEKIDAARQCIKAFYDENGPCCAGCDHWDPIGASVGECTRTAPVAGADRISVLGWDNVTMRIDSGQIVTPREHWCGEFIETETW